MWNARDSSAVDRFVADDFVIVTGGVTVSGRENFKKWIDGFLATSTTTGASEASARVCARRHPVPPFEGMAERRCVGVAQPLRHFLDIEPDIAQQVDRQG